MKPRMSKALQAWLLATLVLCVIAVLKPSPREGLADADLLPAAHHARSNEKSGNERPAPGPRKLYPPLQAAVSQGFVAPPPLSPPVPPPVPIRPPVPVQVAPVVIARPEAPTPGFTYLGRMLRENDMLVFLRMGENTEVVTVGEMIDQNWRLEGVDDQGIKLRYMPLGELRRLVVSQ